MKRRQPVFVGDMISKIVKNDQILSQGMKESDIMRAWKEIAGEQLSTYTSRIYIRNSTMYVEFSSAAAKSTFFENRHHILREINRVAGETLIKFISVI